MAATQARPARMEVAVIMRSIAAAVRILSYLTLDSFTSVPLRSGTH
jgi:hypothetical protein